MWYHWLNRVAIEYKSRGEQINSESLLFEFIMILLLGIGAQWVSWLLRIPAIIFLLLTGFVAGIFEMIHPDLLFGQFLSPFVSISVAIILFEGGMSLRFRELKGIGRALRNLVTIGALVNCSIISLASYKLLNLDLKISILLGSILVVTGPTVVSPLLKDIRPAKKLARLLKWEGIMIDPIGAIFALIVFKSIFASSYGETITILIVSLGKMIFIGGTLGILSSALMVGACKRQLIPDYLQETVTLVIVLVTFLASNHLQHESGLMAVTIMGLILANQKAIHVRHIISFKENLTVLLLSSLFIILSARINPMALLSDIRDIRVLLFFLVVVLIARPLTILVSTLGSDFNWREKIFLSLVAPRGIVAVVVSSFFSLRLANQGFESANTLFSYTYIVIIGTVAISGFIAPQLARLLGVSQPKKQGVIIVGAHHFARELGKMLQKENIPTLLIDSSKADIVTSKTENLNAIQSNVLSIKAKKEAGQGTYKYLIALSPNDETNLLATLEYSRIIGRTKVYRLYPEDKTTLNQQFCRIIFGKNVTHSLINAKITAGATIKRFEINTIDDYTSFMKEFKYNSISLFYISEKKKLFFFNDTSNKIPKPGSILYSLVPKPKID